MSACPHTGNADRCTCGPGCGCDIGFAETPPPPTDLADRVIDVIETHGGTVEIWQANMLRQWWGGPRRCVKCRRPTDSGRPLCPICTHEPGAL